jgi:hypothetical protein
MSSLARTALVYDFDGTLAAGNIQEHTFLPEIGITPGEFWNEVKRLARQHDADEILVYMWHMLETARKHGLRITRELLEGHGRKVPLFKGVEGWFGWIASYGKRLGLEIEHYVISSGTHEMIDGCPIRQHFRNLFASRFIYNEAGEAIWPGVAVNYTNKTQFLFRINKGIDNTWDNSRINKWIPMRERPVPFERMVFLGDGETDIPSMKMVRHQGGHSVAVFDPAKWETARTQDLVHRLIAEDRAHFAVPADYSPTSQLAVTIRGVLGRIARDLGYRGED